MGCRVRIEKLAVLLEKRQRFAFVMLVEHVRPHVLVGDFLNVLPAAAGAQRQAERHVEHPPHDLCSCSSKIPPGSGRLSVDGLAPVGCAQSHKDGGVHAVV